MQHMKLNPAISEAIESHEKSRYRIAKETGISQSTLCLFVQGKRNLKTPRLEYLADYLDLEIIVRPKKKKR